MGKHWTSERLSKAVKIEVNKATGEIESKDSELLNKVATSLSELDLTDKTSKKDLVKEIKSIIKLTKDKGIFGK